MCPLNVEGSHPDLARSESILAPASFDLKLQVDAAISEQQRLFEEMFGGELTDIEYSDDSDVDVEAKDAELTPLGSLRDAAKQAGEGREAQPNSHKARALSTFRLAEEDWDRLTSAEKRKMRNKMSGRKKREARESLGLRDGAALKKFKAAEQVDSSILIEDLPRSSTGWEGPRGLPANARKYAKVGRHPTLDQLISGEKMTLIKWDGIHPKVIRDRKGNAIVILVGQPGREGYAEQYAKSCADVHAQLMAGAQSLPPELTAAEGHRRGCFPNPGGGFGMGGGSKRPNPVRFKTTKMKDWWNKTFESDQMQDIIRFTRRSMEAICRSDLDASDGVLNQTCERDERLSRLKGSAFAAATFNIGGRVWTIPHRDYFNRACWFCSVTALGDYCYEQGGHLVLWELGMVIEFPPRATIFLPSALLTHSNVPIEAGTRTSVVQYSAAGLYRYAHCGFRTLKSLRDLGEKEYAAYSQGLESRMKGELSFFRNVGRALGLVPKEDRGHFLSK